MEANTGTLFLRLEGPLQAWGDHQAKFIIRTVAPAPTKSGVIGLLCAALGVSRSQATDKLPELRSLVMGVRVDRPGRLVTDYHIVGAQTGSLTAEGKLKITEKSKTIETFVTRREYLADASFLVALQGPMPLLESLADALRNPVWEPYLGRKSCPPAAPILERVSNDLPDGLLPGALPLRTALARIPWYKRSPKEELPAGLDCWLEWRPTPQCTVAPQDALVWYDEPVSLEPPAHEPRFVLFDTLTADEFPASNERIIPRATHPRWPHADYTNSQYKEARSRRLKHDYHLCVFCKAPATTVQHVTYERAGGQETLQDLRSLCRLCHDAITMLEYGEHMGLYRINPEDPTWRNRIIDTRRDIIRYRSRAARQRMLESTTQEEE